MTVMRPSFLGALTAVSVMVALAGCQAEQTPDEDMTRESGLTFNGDFEGPLGLQLWSVRDYAAEDLSGALSAVYDMGFREVELAGTYGMTPMEFRTVLEDVGLRATASHASYERYQDELQAVLDEAETLGVEYVGVAWIPHPEDQPFTEEMAREAAADFEEWGCGSRRAGHDVLLPRPRLRISTR